MTEYIHYDQLVRRAAIGDQLRRHAALTPERPAIVFHARSGAVQVITYAELDYRSERLARFLSGRGVRVGDRVAVLAGNIPEYVYTLYGSLKVGAAISGINRYFTAEECRFQLDDCSPKILVTDQAPSSTLSWLGSSSGVECVVEVSPSEQGWQVPTVQMSEILGDDSPEIEARVGVDENTIALLQYTSGTEGVPKAVMIPHRNFLISTVPAWMDGLGLRQTDRWLFLLPFHTIAGLGTFTILTVIGATVILMEEVEPNSALKAAAAEDATVVSQTPTFYLRASESHAFEEIELPSLRKCITYGGMISKEAIDRWASRYPHVTWFTYWGQSELTQLGTVGAFDSFEEIPGGDPTWIGKPLSQLEIRVVGEDGQDSERGELLVRSPSVMAGYFRDQKQTEETIRGEWLRTGDIVRRDSEGNLFFVDRRRDVIKTGGMNVSSQEVERILLDHDGVAECAVVGVPDPEWSEAVVAFVVPVSWDEMSEQDLIIYCKSRLASYKAPKRVTFLGGLPRDAQGKIVKRKLRQDGE